MDVTKPKSPQRQFKGLGHRLSFDNALNKQQLKKLRCEGLNAPWCVKPLYLGSRAGSHSPQYASVARFALMVLNCLVVLACPKGGDEVLSSCGFVSLCFQWVWGARVIQGGPVGHSWLNHTDCFHFTPKAQVGGTRTEASCGHQTGRGQQLHITSPLHLCQSLEAW